MTSPDGPTLAIAALMEQLGRQVQNLCFTEELAPVQWAALRYFAKAGPVARTASGLAAYSGVNVSSASRTIRLLRSKGLATIAPDLDDNRIRRVVLTNSGQELLDRDPLAILAEAVTALDEVEQTALQDLLGKVLDRMSAKPFTAGGPLASRRRNLPQML